MPIVAIDLETSGLNPTEDGIIEIALVKFEGDTILEEFSALVNPGFSLTPEVMHLTGITDADLKDKPYFGVIREQVADFIGECPILGHNVEFDINFLKNNGIDLTTHQNIDTFKLGQLFFFKERSMNLGHLCDVLGFSFTDQHRALGDTRATVALYQHILSRIEKLSSEEKEVLSFLYSLAGSNPLWTSGIPFTMQPTSVTHIKDLILGHIGEYKKQDRTTISGIAHTFSDILHAGSGSTEERPEQLRMADTIDEAFKKHTLHLIEAPTGIGKTFAYLIPAILHSLGTGKQVFVSTNTKTLQDQIIFKDVPRLQEMFCAVDERYVFSVSKVKGRRNYLGLLPFFDFLDGETFEEHEILCIGKILMWLLETRDGELDELNFYGKEFEMLKSISADDRRVLEAWNPFKNHEFLYKARSSAKDSNIVIINHALLTQDTEDTSAKILPEVEYLIVDEAHNLENVATESFKHTTSLQMLETTFTSLEHALKRYKKHNPDDEYMVADFNEIRESIFLYFSMLLESLGEYITERSGMNNSYTEGVEKTSTSVLIENDFYTRSYIVSTHTILQALLTKAHTLVTTLYAAPENLFRRIEKYVTDLDAHVAVLQKTFSSDTDGLIKILARNDRSEIYVQYTFLSIGNILRERLWLKLQTGILTSATLQVGESFSYIQKTLGATQFETLELASDFDYSKQALVFLPTDIGDIRNSETRKQANQFIFDLIKIVGGRTLCLFTSFAAMKETFVQIYSSMKEIGIELLTQGIGGSKQKLLENFKKNSSKSVLFGTDSFWEGVDIPGSDVEVLVIHKFPFMVPTDPIFQARSRLFNDSFLEYSVPAMILKLKQGIGRLIRTKTDKGVIVILDRRIDSRWGQLVRDSFPAGIPVRSGLSADFLRLLSSKKDS